MKVYAISDLHIDYTENRQWLQEISRSRYKEDILILGGDVTDNPEVMKEAFLLLAQRFYKVTFVPGNHDLWVGRCKTGDSFQKFHLLKDLAADCGIAMEPVETGNLSIIPLFSWYDYSFGEPSERLRNRWSDYVLSNWGGKTEKEVNHYFMNLNRDFLEHKGDRVITFSHFLPRKDLIPHFVPGHVKELLPVMGTATLEQQIIDVSSTIHVYGHSHFNRNILKDGRQYVNNAFGYPYESMITQKELVTIYSGG